MIQESELLFLSNWQNFYMIMGTAAATLTGLMFVVTTLIAGIDAHMSTLNAAVSAYNTPTVVHFGTVLLLAGLLSAPWQTFSSLSLLLGLLGLGMVLYSTIVMRRMLLLLVGIRNAWDMVTFLAVERAHFENRSTQ